MNTLAKPERRLAGPSDGRERHAIAPNQGQARIHHRPQLDVCLDYLRPGDTLVVWRVDRLARSLRHLLEIIDDLKSR